MENIRDPRKNQGFLLKAQSGKDTSQNAGMFNIEGTNREHTYAQIFLLSPSSGLGSQRLTSVNSTSDLLTPKENLEACPVFPTSELCRASLGNGGAVAGP